MPRRKSIPGLPLRSALAASASLQCYFLRAGFLAALRLAALAPFVPLVALTGAAFLTGPLLVFLVALAAGRLVTFAAARCLLATAEPFFFAADLAGAADFLPAADLPEADLAVADLAAALTGLTLFCDGALGLG